MERSSRRMQRIVIRLKRGQQVSRPLPQRIFLGIRRKAALAGQSLSLKLEEGK
ncbi:MAG: hypothetical protein Kow0099_31880 [Candidatus Abyssubacteria bacterium]